MQFVKVAAHGLIKKDGKYLATRRPIDDDYMPNLWDTPGGTINFGEKIIDALNREIKEETDLTVKVSDVIFCYNHLSGEERHQFELVYSCDYIGGEIKLDPQEHQEYRWVTLEEMESLPKIEFLEELFKFLKNRN